MLDCLLLCVVGWLFGVVWFALWLLVMMRLLAGVGCVNSVVLNASFDLCCGRLGLSVCLFCDLVVCWLLFACCFSCVYLFSGLLGLGGWV